MPQQDIQGRCHPFSEIYLLITLYFYITEEKKKKPLQTVWGLGDHKFFLHISSC